MLGGMQKLAEADRVGRGWRRPADSQRQADAGRGSRRLVHVGRGWQGLGEGLQRLAEVGRGWEGLAGADGGWHLEVGGGRQRLADAGQSW